MTRLALLRHGRTSWNEDGRLQGRADIGLSPDGERALAGKRLPAGFAHAACYCSPLKRARQTALLLGLQPVYEPALIEMDWGGYEGQRLVDLRARHGDELRQAERKGLDFRPPGGESPRDVQQRLAPWLAGIAKEAGSVVAVTHKGVIRALLAAAYDWDMTGRPPVKIDWERLQVLRLDPGGRPRPDAVNLALQGP